MGKKFKITLIIAAAALIAAISILIYNAGTYNNLVSTRGSPKSVSDARDGAGPASDSPSSTGQSSTQGEAAPAPEPDTALEKKDIDVLNNSLQYDLKATLFENNRKETYLKFDYYNDGLNVSREFDAQSIPELSGVFEKSRELPAGSKGYAIRPVYLDGKYSKAYFIFEGAPDGNETGTAVYSFDLKKIAINRLFAETGLFSDLSFTKDGRYAAFGYTSAKAKGVSFLQVVDCKEDLLAVSKNLNIKGKPIGQAAGLKQTGGYSFVSWNTNSVAKLKGVFRDANSGTPVQKDMFYDIENDAFLNPDGTPLSAGTGAKGRDTQQAAKDSEPVKALKSFYAYLSSGQYDKAYDLLDDRFRLNVLKQFGIDELSKSDINVQEFSQYGVFLRAAKIKNIVGEKTEGNTSHIYYYQALSLDDGDKVQPIAVTMNKSAKGWRIAAVNDGDPDRPPFK